MREGNSRLDETKQKSDIVFTSRLPAHQRAVVQEIIIRSALPNILPVGLFACGTGGWWE